MSELSWLKASAQDDKIVSFKHNFLVEYLAMNGLWLGEIFQNYRIDSSDRRLAKIANFSEINWFLMI